MSLKKRAERVRDSGGLLHSVNLRALRHYIGITPEKKLVSEVAEIKDPALLRAVWEAGVSSVLQDAVLDRLKKIA